jgi:accessory colonization factor AcfC
LVFIFDHQSGEISWPKFKETNPTAKRILPKAKAKAIAEALKITLKKQQKQAVKAAPIVIAAANPEPLSR